MGGDNAFDDTGDTFTVSRASADLQPDAFSFSSNTGVNPSSIQTSGTITIAGISSGVNVGIQVSGGTYSKNNAAYTSASGTVALGDTISLRHTSSSSYNTSVTTSVTVSSGSNARNASFTSTTGSAPQDTTPNAFNLQDITNASPSTVYQSVAQQITGITGNVSVSISGDGNPQFQIGGGNNAWQTSGSIQNNYYINARLTSSATAGATHTATLTIGTVSDTISVTTVGSSSGGSTGVGGGSGNYGLEIYDTDGSTKVISPSTRYIVALKPPTSITVPANSTVLVQMDMTGLTTSNSSLVFLDFGNNIFTIGRVTTGAVSQQGFTITNPHNFTLSNVTPYIIRF